MKQELMKTFIISITTTIVYYTYIGLFIRIDVEPEWLTAVFSIIFIYGSLFVSFATLTRSKAHRLVTFKYGLVSTLSKWLLFYAGITLSISNDTITNLIVVITFLISLTADIGMFIAIKHADIESIQHHIKDHHTKDTEQDTIKKKRLSNFFIYLVILLVLTSIVIQRVNYYYDIVFHMLIIYFGILKLYKTPTLPYPLKLTIPYVILTYSGAFLLSYYFKDIFDTVWLTLPLAVIIYLPFIVFYIKEGSKIHTHLET